MPKEWEIDLGIPDIGSLIMLSFLCLFSGLMFLVSLYTTNMVITRFFPSYTDFITHTTSMSYEHSIAVAEISVFITVATTMFIYSILTTPLFKPKTLEKKKKYGSKAFIISILLLLLAFIEICIAISIGIVSNITLSDYIILPVTMLLVTALITFATFFVIINELYYLTHEEERLITTKTLLKPFFSGIILYASSIFVLIIGLLILR